jgi:hypothetical protein
VTLPPDCTITHHPAADESLQLDHLLWDVLWRPLGLPRDFRESVKQGGPEYEVVARGCGRVIGGIVATRTSRSAVEIRHIAVLPEVQGQGVGSRLVASLAAVVYGEGCTRITTVARNTSAGFFARLGFTAVPDTVPPHPGFIGHGISFLRMEQQIG